MLKELDQLWSRLVADPLPIVLTGLVALAARWLIRLGARALLVILAIALASLGIAELAHRGLIQLSGTGALIIYAIVVVMALVVSRNAWILWCAQATLVIGMGLCGSAEIARSFHWPIEAVAACFLFALFWPAMAVVLLAASAACEALQIHHPVLAAMILLTLLCAAWVVAGDQQFSLRPRLAQIRS